MEQRFRLHIYITICCRFDFSFLQWNTHIRWNSNLWNKSVNCLQFRCRNAHQSKDLIKEFCVSIKSRYSTSSAKNIHTAKKELKTKNRNETVEFFFYCFHTNEMVPFANNIQYHCDMHRSSMHFARLEIVHQSKVIIKNQKAFNFLYCELWISKFS